MVKITGSRKLEMFVIHHVISEEEARTKVEAQKKKAFGMLSSFFGKGGHEIMVSGYLCRYEPFWYMEGESLLEYTRKSQYSFSVKPEVRSVTINGASFDVDPESPVLSVEGQDHCYESFSKHLVKNALGGSDKKLDTYRKAPAHKLKSLKDLHKKDVVVIEPTIKASYLIRDLIKDLIRPFDADKVLQEKVIINTISLFFRPIHVFELTRGPKSATLEVDGITGVVSKSSPFRNQIAQKLRQEQTWFDVGTELASVVVPGAGAGVVISKHLKDRYDKKKQLKAMQASQRARKKIEH